MKKTIKQQGMWDILIPLMLIIVVLPLAVRLAIYSCGYSKYEWYSVNDTLTDFYCYYKGYLLDIIGIFAGIILVFRLALYREKTKNMKIFIPIAVYVVLTLLSTVFSVNPEASLKGNFESFESCLVLIAYAILALYAYQVTEYERDYKYIWYSVLIISAIFSVIGAFQIFGHDLMNFEWIQRLVMSEEQFSLYAGEIEDTFTGNNVYLTLYNPNYAGVTLCMLFAVVWVMALSETQKKLRTVWFLCSAVMLTLIWFTYSRASLMAAILLLVLGSIKFLKRKKQLLAASAGMLAFFALFICIDAGFDFKYISRMVDKNTREPLTAMTTDERGIHLTYDGADYCLYLENDTLLCQTDAAEAPLTATAGDSVSLPFEENTEVYWDGEEIHLYLAENTLSFIYEEGMYYYITPSMTPAQMVPVEKADFHGLEYLGSARGYIWSRTLPLLKDYLLIGSGPDTFAEVFPQHDYAGKIVYSDRPDMIIEKAHNDYLTKWIQTGGLSVLCLLVFYFMLIKTGTQSFSRKNSACDLTGSIQARLGFGCYLACLSFMFTSLFNDSTLQTSPLFWVFAGITLSSIYKKRTD